MPKTTLIPTADQIAIEGALQLAAGIYDQHAKDTRLPERIREQFARQHGDAIRLHCQIEEAESLLVETA